MILRKSLIICVGRNKTLANQNFNTNCSDNLIFTITLLTKIKINFRKLNRKELLGEEEINLLKLYLALRGISFDQETLQGNTHDI